MPLTIDQRDQDGCAVLALRGDLDVATAPALTSAARAAIESTPRHLVLDATDLDFCDSTGLATFVRIAAQLEPHGHRLGIAGVQPIVRRILEVSGLDQAFVVTGTVVEATSHLLAVAT
jgi:anti-sigma B factor antagonist